MKTCDHDQCGCKITDDSAVSRDGKVFCSTGCADGTGCNHAGCTCQSVNKGHEPHGRKHSEQNPASNPANKAAPTKPAPAENPRTSFNPAQGAPSIRNNPEAAKRR